MRSFLPLVPSLLALSWFLSNPESAHAADVKPEALRRGLVATYRDGNAPTTHTVVQIDPTIALSLGTRQAAHPRLAVGAGSVKWEGYINLLRPGKYSFVVRLRGSLSLHIGDRKVLEAVSKADTPAVVQGKPVELPTGVHPLRAEYTQPSGPARLELFWVGPGFRREPLTFRVLGHLPEQARKTQGQQVIEEGRFLTEEASCVRCHAPGEEDSGARTLVSRQGPDLSQVGARLYPGWIEHWLENPRKLRPTGNMPRMFTDDEAGRVARYAVTRYLVSLGGPLTPQGSRLGEKQLATSQARGQRLFNSVGCLACHGTDGQGGKRPDAVLHPLPGLGSKTTPYHLAAFLKDPLALAPSGRMPNMLLNNRDAEDLAYFLTQRVARGVNKELSKEPTAMQLLSAFQRVEDRAAELTAFQKLRPRQQWVDLGKRVVIEKGCNNCHVIAPGGKPFAEVKADATLADIRQARRHQRGCLAEEQGKRGKAPEFGFSKKQVQAVRAFLSKGLDGAGSTAPAHRARVDLRRFNCLACHKRQGQGGLTGEVIEQLRRYEKAENAEAVLPPSLTDVGHKLRTPWLRQVLLEAGRARPWMSLRMPQFGKPNVGHLPEALAALDGTVADDSIHKVAHTDILVKAGRLLVGRKAFGCVSCHDIAGIPNLGTRGPDLASMTQRIRYQWYLRWLEQPQRMEPGTRMPSVFFEGQSLMDTVLKGDAGKQAEAMWAYLSLGKNLPLPEGLEPTQSLQLAVRDRALLLRTFMPDAGARAIAVGYPGEVSLAFDAQTCRLVYVWSGKFLDASPVWANRGGRPAKVLGSRIWTAPAGCPIGLGTASRPPDFAARAKNPAYGAHLPQGKIYNGPRLLQFQGYDRDVAGIPTFHYRLREGTRTDLEIHERLQGVRSPVAVGVERRFQVIGAEDGHVWILLTESTQEPKVLDAAGKLHPMKGSEMPVRSGEALYLAAESRRVVLSGKTDLKGCQWHKRRMDGRWQVLVRLPKLPRGKAGDATVRVWIPNRPEPSGLKVLVGR